MTELPEYLSSGDQARLFPILAETSKEKRVASIFLSVMTQIPAVAENVLGTVGVRVGKRTRVRAFTEVVFREKSISGCRPDGLIVVETGRNTWSALIEAKVGKNDLDSDQVQRYVEVARSQGIDAVITISNQFVARADQPPVPVPKNLLRKVGLYHWSWTWLATICEILAYAEEVTDSEQSYLLNQLNDFFAHPATGIERFTQMAPEWKDVVQAISNDVKLKKTAQDVENVASSWLAEERDLCLHLSSHVGRQVEAIIERRLQGDPEGRRKQQIDALVEHHCLKSTIRVPDCASDIALVADLARKTICCSMTVKAPGDRKSTKARMNWLLRMLPDNDERLLVRAHWPGRGAPTTKLLSELRETPESIQTENADLVPHSFEVLLVDSLGKRFSGRKTFIEDLEKFVPAFYDIAGVNLKAWQAAPPKPIKPRNAPDPGEIELQDLGAAGALPQDGTA
ncbi:hypothetical protein [Martelella sp. AMO21009]